MGFWSLLEKSSLTRKFIIVYTPRPDDKDILPGAQTQEKEGLEVTAAVLDSAQSQKYFGVPMGRRGVQPIWLRIVNRSDSICRLHLVSIDPNYYSPHEAAAVNHYSFAKRLLGFGMLGLLSLPLLLFVPLKLISASRVNRMIDEFFRDQAFRLRPIEPGKRSQGFVFTPLDVGSKIVHVRLLRRDGIIDLNLTTHRIDPDVDESRDYVLEDLLEAERLDQVGYVGGVGECDKTSPRHNLTGDPYFTDGYRGIAVVWGNRTTPKFIEKG